LNNLKIYVVLFNNKLTEKTTSITGIKRLMDEYDSKKVNQIYYIEYYAIKEKKPTKHILYDKKLNIKNKILINII